MKISRSLPAGCILAVSLLSLQTSCATRSPESLLPEVQQSSEALSVESVVFCPPAISSRPQGNLRARVLIDASGSMAGFHENVPRLDEWILRGLSQTAGSSIHFASQKCYFRQGLHVYGCVQGDRVREPFHASGNTNLDEAIQSAADTDVTVIITDGIAASGSGNGDCASGVDFACIGRSLKNVTVPRAGFSRDTRPGIWVVPILSSFDGSFYTEERLSPDQFVATEARDNIQKESGTNAEITRPRAGSDGRLVFDYKGPRILLAIVLTTDSSIGRAVVEGLIRTAETSQIPLMRSLQEFTRGTALLTPIELFPGYLPPVSWITKPTYELDERDQPRIRGTLNEQWHDPNTIELECAKNQSNEAIYHLSGKAQPAGAGCVKFLMLPQLRIEAMSSQENAGALKGFQSSKSNEELRLRVACSENIPVKCNSPGARIDFVGQSDFRKTADCVDAANCASGAAKEIRELSTDNPSRFPHRVFGLNSLLRKFYQEVAGETASISFASVVLCKGAN